MYSKTWEDHVHHLRKILECLRETGLAMNPEKFYLGLQETQYLGFMVGKGKLRPEQGKVETLRQVETPKTKTDVCCFLGLAGYYQWFIPHFSTIAQPLTDLTRKTEPSNIRGTKKMPGGLWKDTLWKTGAEGTRLYTTICCTSNFGLGAVLMQIHEGMDHPIMYLSKKLLPQEQNYSTIEKEAYASKWEIDGPAYVPLRSGICSNHWPPARHTVTEGTRMYASLGHIWHCSHIVSVSCIGQDDKILLTFCRGTENTEMATTSWKKPHFFIIRGEVCERADCLRLASTWADGALPL